MKKELAIGLLIGFVAITATFVFIFVINPAISKTGKSVEETPKDILENVLFEPAEFNISIEKGEEKTMTLEIINNNEKTLFFRCAIYNSASVYKNKPKQTCETNEETIEGFMEIPTGETKSFAVKVQAEKDEQYMNPEGEVYNITTHSGEYNNKLLIAVGSKAAEQEIKEIPLDIIVA